MLNIAPYAQKKNKKSIIRRVACVSQNLFTLKKSDGNLLTRANLAKRNGNVSALRLKRINTKIAA